MIIALLYGLVIGSFLNVLILRLPKEEDVVFGGSHCMQCGYRLKWYDLIPVVSYLVLRGKCRKCKKKISIQYPIIELLNGMVYVGIAMINGWQLSTIVFLLTFSILIVVSVIDYRYMIIPDSMVVSIFVLGVANTLLTGAYIDHIIGLFAVSSILFLIAVITKGKMGGGDIKLMAAAGLLLGWKGILMALMLGSVVGSVIGLTLMAMKKIEKKQMIPFGPFLCLGIAVAMLFEEILLNWYVSMFL